MRGLEGNNSVRNERGQSCNPFREISQSLRGKMKLIGDIESCEFLQWETSNLTEKSIKVAVFGEALEVEVGEVGKSTEEAREEREGLNTDSERESEIVGDGE